MPNYWIWERHGEVSQEVGNESGLGGYWHENDEQCGDTWEENAAQYQSMVVDAFPHQHAWTNDYEEEPNPEAKKFFELLASVRRPLWEGSAFSQLSAEFDQWKSHVSQMYAFMQTMQGTTSGVIPPPPPPPSSSLPPPRHPPAAAPSRTETDPDDGSSSDDEDDYE
ncbi:hypothetical protein PIB30_062701 [Stylosanthes scabra]|uniref:Uncharacterized protein n=1 Tax=Stylosanthes scabra TaxID=79078 RepID=A0ABU6QLM1_9FABA|nr:hypothetical protein [Stylosanthes scabra]